MTISTKALKKEFQTRREKTFAKLYESTFPVVSKLVKRLGGTLEEAKDLFQDAMIIFYEKIVHQEVNIKVSPQAYLVGIAKKLWLKKYQRQQYIPLNDIEQSISIPPDFYEPVNRNEKRLLTYLQKAGQKCVELLQAFYYFKWPMKEIANNFNYANVRSATVQKYKCLEKVRKTIKDKSLEYEGAI